MKQFPQQDDQICIIGAGASGLHMAYLLKEKGFNHITILEIENRIGGKCFTKSFNGIRHDLGASMLNRGYTELLRLIDQFKLDELVPNHFEKKTHSYNNTIYSMDDIILSLYQYKNPIIRKIIKPYKLLRFYLSYKKYLKIHKKIFNNEEFIYQSKIDLNEINMTFYDFLKKHKLLDLADFFRITFTIQYTYLEVAPALYGLWWCSPELIESIMTSTMNKRKIPFFRLRHGFQPLFEKMAELSNAKILLEYKITTIERGNKIKIVGNYQDKPSTLNFDFLIISSGLKNILNVLDSTAQEKEIFSKLEYSYPVMTVFKATDNFCQMKTANCVWYDMTFQATSTMGSVNLVREYARYLNLEAINEKGEKERVYITFQPHSHHHPRKTKEQLIDDLKCDLVNKGYRSPQLLYQCYWEYFPMFQQADINNEHPWKILNMQGLKKTWYIGASVSFESIKDVMNYNKMLINTLPIK